MSGDGAPTRMVCFATALGWCGLAWRGASLTRFVLPEEDADEVRTALRRHREGVHADAGAELEEVDPDAPDLPGWVRETIADVVEHLGGRPVDFRWVPVDLTGLQGTAREVYEVTQRIPGGQTMTYGEVARAIGQPGGAQAVGSAMGRNPIPLIVPCHRVVGADGRLVGFSATGGVAMKRRLLEIEGAEVVAQGSLF